MSIIDTRFYYYRDERKRPLVTLCRITTESGQMAYAWAICSPCDQPHKEKDLRWDGLRKLWYQVPGGKTIAYGRALRSLRTGKPINDTVKCYARQINRQDACDVLADCRADALFFLSEHGDMTRLPKSMQPGEMHVTPQQ